MPAGPHGRLWEALRWDRDLLYLEGAEWLPERQRTGLGIRLESLLTWMGLAEGRAGRTTGNNRDASGEAQVMQET